VQGWVCAAVAPQDNSAELPQSWLQARALC